MRLFFGACFYLYRLKGYMLYCSSFCAKAEMCSCFPTFELCRICQLSRDKSRTS